MQVLNDPLIQMLERASIAITLADATSPDQELVFVNRAFERLTGYDRNEILGHNCRFLQGPDTDPVMRQKIREAIAHDRPFAGTLRNYTKSGTPFENLLVIRPVQSSKSHLRLLMGCQFVFTGQFDVDELREHLDTENNVFASLVDRL